MAFEYKNMDICQILNNLAMGFESYIPEDIKTLYEIHDYKHAAAILANEFKEEFEDVCSALRRFAFSELDIKTAGGNESQIPKKFSELLRPLQWNEKKLEAKLIVDGEEINHGSHKM